MSAGNSIIGDCAECCVCPQPMWDQAQSSYSMGLVGWEANDYTGYGDCRRYLTITDSHSYAKSGYTSSSSFIRNYDPFTGAETTSETFSFSEGEISGTCSGNLITYNYGPGNYVFRGVEKVNSEGYSEEGCAGYIIVDCGEPCIEPISQETETSTTVTCDLGYYDYTNNPNYTIVVQGHITRTLSNLNESLTYENVESRLPAYSAWISDSGQVVNVSSGYVVNREDTCVTGIYLYKRRYRLRFKIPASGCYRASWVERFIPEAGVGLTSLEIINRGVYRPTVTLSAPPTGGTQARAIAVMSSTGTISDIAILNPGAGYIPLITFSGGGGTGAAAYAVVDSLGAVTSVVVTSAGSGYSSAPTVAFTNVTAPRVRATGTASISGGMVIGVTVGTAGDFRPTVTVEAAISGGTSSTGWTATLTDGEVTAISGGSAGNYLPTLTIIGGGGSGATATAALDAQGGISSITVTAAGSAYASTPAILVSAKVNVLTSAVIHPHLGTETKRCAKWDGVTPTGYDPANYLTYPTLPSNEPRYYDLDVPESEGQTVIANTLILCDCSSCSE